MHLLCLMLQIQPRLLLLLLQLPYPRGTPPVLQPYSHSPHPEHLPLFLLEFSQVLKHGLLSPFQLPYLPHHVQFQLP
ncbi:hypothetical protein BC629DRAFT_1518965 [Irpex lacteus]|nr:hypothetical protein BC629DRAFT_1518965 [Irpex lacteus]